MFSTTYFTVFPKANQESITWSLGILLLLLFCGIYIDPKKYSETYRKGEIVFTNFILDIKNKSNNVLKRYFDVNDSKIKLLLQIIDKLTEINPDNRYSIKEAYDNIQNLYIMYNTNALTKYHKTEADYNKLYNKYKQKYMKLKNSL